MCCCCTYWTQATDVVLEEWISTARQSNVSVDLLDAVERYQQVGDRQEVLNHLLELADEKAAQQSESLLIDLQRLIGQLYAQDFQQYNAAKPYLESALDRLSKTKQPESYLSTLFWYTHVHYWLFEAEATTALALEGLELAEATNDKRSQMLFQQWLGQAFALQSDWGKAIEYYNQMRQLAIQQGDMPDFQFGAQLNIAVALHKSGQSDTALLILEAGLPYLEELPADYEGRNNYLIWRGVMLGATEQYAESEATLKQVMTIYDSLQLPNRQMHSRIELSNVYIKQNKQRAAIRVLNDVLQIAPKNITRFERKYVHSLLYRAYRELRDFEQAIFHGEAVKDVDMEIDSINNAQTIQELEKKYENAKQQQIIDEQQHELAQRKWLYLALLLSVLLLGSMLLVTYNLNRSKKKLAEQNKIIQEQAEELQTLDQLKSNFFINVSHELRTPLTLILAPINSIIKSNTLNNRNFTLLKKAQQSGQDLKKMIGSILDLSKLEANKMELDAQPTLLYQFTKRLAAAFESQADIRNITYTFRYDADQDLKVNIDQEKLAIVINNLLSNALKFTNSNGEVHFRVRDLGSQLKLTVQDTGRGIHEDDLPHIFDRFYQSKQKIDRVEGGTGIGLSLTKEYVKLMEGDLIVESELEKGSTFTATIAKHEMLGIGREVEMGEELLASYEMVKTSTELSSISSGRRLLVVEDNSSLRDYLRTLLSPHYQVSLAANGQKALEVLTTLDQLPDLILSDVMMPEMDGYELLETLKASDTYRGIPVVMLTARADLQDKLKALRIGVDDYMLKPFEEEELLVRIHNLLANSQIRQATQQLISVIDTEEGVHVPTISIEDQTWLTDVETLLKDQLSNSTYSITQLAGDIALSERQVRRRLKQLVGLSPSQYFKAIRLQHARQLLEQNRYNTVAQTAAAVGFRDAGAFSKAYKAAYGKLPSEV
jgi:signal transduction histidine kinase/DNA-binding response OmpR family regulator